QGYPHRLEGAPWWLGDGALRVVPRWSRAASYAARRHRLRLRRSPHHVWRHWRQGVDLQGRGASGHRGLRALPKDGDNHAVTRESQISQADEGPHEGYGLPWEQRLLR